MYIFHLSDKRHSGYKSVSNFTGGCILGTNADINSNICLKKGA